MLIANHTKDLKLVIYLLSLVLSLRVR